jgi:hypothetical protein
LQHWNFEMLDNQGKRQPRPASISQCERGTKTQAAEWERDTSSNTSARVCWAAVGQSLASDRQPRSSSTANEPAAIGQSFHSACSSEHYSRCCSGLGIFSSTHHFEKTIPFSSQTSQWLSASLVNARQSVPLPSRPPHLSSRRIAHNGGEATRQSPPRK